MAKVVVGVAGGIAAYKVPVLVRLFREDGHDVTVVPTHSALQFVGAPTWAALSGNRVSTEVWDRVEEVAHVRIGQEADLVVVAPATADLVARAAAGMANDLLTATLLTARCPVVMAPAMHTEMWEHPATQANIHTLRSRGVVVIEPAVGRLTGADSGIGRLPEVEGIFEHCLSVLAGTTQDLMGIRVLLSAGGTREAVDPVRFLGNRSSGKQGYALASAAVQRGAMVTLVSANVSAPPPAGVTVIPVVSAAQMHEAMLAHAQQSQVIVMSAAVADFRPTQVSDVKLKKGSDQEPTVIALERNPDILAALVAQQTSTQITVGFAAETGDDNGEVAAYGKAKLAKKECDFLVVNDVSHGKAFDLDENEVTILSKAGGEVVVALSSKAAIATAIWDQVAAELARRRAGTNTP